MILLIAIAQVICKIEFRLILLIIQTDAGESSAKKKFYARDQLKLDFKWIVSEEDDDRTLAEMIAQIKEEATSIASAVAELEKLIGEVEE